MAGGPQLPRLSASAEEALAAHQAGRISGEVALMRLLLSGLPAAELPARLAHRPDLGGLAQRHAAGLARLERLVRAGGDHAAVTPPEATRAMFDRLVAISPEAAVAAYSLGDSATLARATQEVVGWLRAEGLLAGRPRVLDLGCGIGRVAAAVAPEARCVLGLDISPAMVAAARARHGHAPALRFDTCSGRDLAGIADGAFDLVLAVDVFPYLMLAGPEVAAGMMAEAARVLPPGGQCVVFNLAYGEADPAALAAAGGLLLEEAGTRPFALWDASVFRFRRPGLEAPGRL